MPVLFLDFETRSRVNLKTAGAYRYAEDASTEALCAGWALDHGPVQRWHRGEPADWLLYAQHSDVTIVAHNAEFERLILKHLFHLDLPATRFRCTAALAARYGIPRSLDKAGKALGIEHLKDTKTGDRVIHKLCKPRPAGHLKGTFYEEDEVPDDYDDLADYNETDVEAMREIYYLLPALSDTEQALWELTVRMNDRGLPVDMPNVKRAHVLAADEQVRLEARWYELVGCGLKAHMKAREVLGMEAIHKLAVRNALRDPNLPAWKREALEIRQKAAKTSVAKLAALLQRTQRDNVYRGGLVYSGAERTQRWSGRGVQPQNLPVGFLADAMDLAFETLEAGAMELWYSDMLVTISEMLKGFFVGPFLVGDYSQIEARTLAWFAGQTDLVQAFADGRDVYCDMASIIYGTPITKKDFDEELRIAKRQLGKVTVLGCGYGLGAKTFQRQLDAKFAIDITLERAYEIIGAYRGRYQRIPDFWDTMERLYKVAVERDSKVITWENFRAGVRSQEFGGRKFAYIQMPSGRPLWYYQPKANIPDEWPDGTPKLSLGYKGRVVPKADKKNPEGTGSGRGGPTTAGGHHSRDGGQVFTYGGKLTENVVQAFSRDVMADAMLRLDKAGFPLVLTVHDEIVAQAGADGLPEFKRIMEKAPEWAEGLPIAVEAFATRRYHK